jgi:5-methylcytosine-specific restriction enzyme A
VTSTQENRHPFAMSGPELKRWPDSICSWCNQPRRARQHWRPRRRSGLPLKVRIAVLRRDNYQCQLCRLTSADAALEIDHKIPVAKDGSNDFVNLWVLCRPCNQRKGVSDLLSEDEGKDQ